MPIYVRQLMVNSVTIISYLQTANIAVLCHIIKNNNNKKVMSYKYI